MLQDMKEERDVSQSPESQVSPATPRTNERAHSVRTCGGNKVSWNHSVLELGTH